MSSNKKNIKLLPFKVNLNDSLSSMHGDPVATGRIAAGAELPRLGATVTGRVKARWGSSVNYRSNFQSSYRAGLPGTVQWLGARPITQAPVSLGSPISISNTAVHPAYAKHSRPDIQYRGGRESFDASTDSRNSGVQSKRGRLKLSKPSIWTCAALIIAFIVLLPVLSVVWLAFNPEENLSLIHI